MPFPRAKANLYDAGTHVPLAIRLPAKAKAGQRRDDFVVLTDLAPTLLEAAGLTPPAAMTGRTLMPLLAGSRQADRDRVFVERERHAHVRRGDLSYPRARSGPSASSTSETSARSAGRPAIPRCTSRSVRSATSTAGPPRSCCSIAGAIRRSPARFALATAKRPRGGALRPAQGSGSGGERRRPTRVPAGARRPEADAGEMDGETPATPRLERTTTGGTSIRTTGIRGSSLGLGARGSGLGARGSGLGARGSGLGARGSEPVVLRGNRDATQAARHLLSIE